MTRTILRVVLLLLLGAGDAAAQGDELRDDLEARRARFMERLGTETLFVHFSATLQTFSHDVEYEYRQNSDLYYLTGITQDETILVLMPGNETRKAILFVKPSDPVQEHWEGHILTAEEATAVSGIDTVYTTPEFEPFMDAMLNGRPFRLPRSNPPPEYDAFFAALREARAKVAMLLDPAPSLARPIGEPRAFANRLRERFVGFTLTDVRGDLHALRQIKTPYEQRILEESVRISAEAHRAGMRAAFSGVHEYEVEAAIEYVYLARGGLGWGYPSIVASGPNATILHYNASRRLMQDNDLLLVDAAGTYQYLTGDITRTYPVSGRFTSEQKAIYEVVLAAQEAAWDLATPGLKTSDLHDKTVEIVKQGLLDLGLITDTEGDQYQHWYTHGAVHFIGLDVHDVGSYQRPLEPGMTFVIEPGIYVREGVLDRLPPTPENQAFIEAVRPAYERFKHIGVRIEDSFLMTETGLKRLSADVPRTVAEVEAFLGARPARPTAEADNRAR